MKATITNTLLASAMLLALAGCARDDEGKGPAERVGKALDQATAGVTRSVKDEIARADDAVDEARNKVGNATEEASRGLERATEKMGKSVERAGQAIQENAARDKDD
jgi:predicted small lipoprotein YifL